jgi:hypothetical protein
MVLAAHRRAPQIEYLSRKSWISKGRTPSIPFHKCAEKSEALRLLLALPQADHRQSFEGSCDVLSSLKK